MTTAEIIQKCKAILAQHYGSQFHGLILYGSVARNQATSMSDIDLLVILNKPFDYFSELRNIVDKLYPVQFNTFANLKRQIKAVGQFCKIVPQGLLWQRYWYNWNRIN